MPLNRLCSISYLHVGIVPSKPVEVFNTVGVTSLGPSNTAQDNYTSSFHNALMIGLCIQNDFEQLVHYTWNKIFGVGK